MVAVALEWNQTGEDARERIAGKELQRCPSARRHVVDLVGQPHATALVTAQVDHDPQALVGHALGRAGGDVATPMLPLKAAPSTGRGRAPARRR